ncbi:MAG: tetratricopeptide repeat protein, partial [Proteobacteria bacterium]|nr:tetratricopeptide repeat protein [Pseudomonadota bacterium]
MGRTGLFLVFMGILLLMPLTALAASAGKMVSKGNTAYAAGKYDEALKAYEEASVVAPESARIYFNKGAAYYRQGDYTRAIEAFENAALNNRDGVIDARARFNLGNCAFRVAEGQKDHDPRQSLDAYKKSIRHFQEALERDAGFTEAAENIEVVRLIMKSVLDEIKKQEEAAQKEQADAEKTAEKIKQLIEDQQALLDRNMDLSTREREDGADDALQGKPAD